MREGWHRRLESTWTCGSLAGEKTTSPPPAVSLGAFTSRFDNTVRFSSLVQCGGHLVPMLQHFLCWATCWIDFLAVGSFRVFNKPTCSPGCKASKQQGPCLSIGSRSARSLVIVRKQNDDAGCLDPLSRGVDGSRYACIATQPHRAWRQAAVGNGRHWRAVCGNWRSNLLRNR